jgi:hypothetical protein
MNEERMRSRIKRRRERKKMTKREQRMRRK